jgi:large subunit ribosomal protein L19
MPGCVFIDGILVARRQAGAKDTGQTRSVKAAPPGLLGAAALTGLDQRALSRPPSEGVMHTSPKLAELESKLLRTDLPDFRVGDSVRVHYRIVEGDKERTQVFQGVVIKRHRAGARSTFTVRKVSFNVGVERIFLSHSPRIEKVEVVSRGVVRRARLFYLRNLAGKAARVRDEKDV